MDLSYMGNYGSMMFLPFSVNFKVLSIGAKASLNSVDGNVVSEQRVNMVLEADALTDIILSNGDSLSDVEAHVSIIPFEQSTLESGVPAGEIGYLIQTTNFTPRVLGLVLWHKQSLPYHLLTPGLKTTASMTFSSLNAADPSAAPYRWKEGPEHRLHISSFEISSGLSLE